MILIIANVLGSIANTIMYAKTVGLQIIQLGLALTRVRNSQTRLTQIAVDFEADIQDQDSEVPVGVEPVVTNCENISVSNSTSISHLDVSTLAKSPINVKKLIEFSKNYDKNEVDFLIDGFTKGFSLCYTGPRKSRLSKNSISINKNPEEVRKQIFKEVSAGRIAGPYLKPPFDNLIVSPISLISKKNNKWRLVHNLSYPYDGSSINANIDPDLCSVQYTHFDKAVEIIQLLGRNCKLFKSDLKNAYRNLPIRLEDIHLQGFHFENRFFVDKALAFGCSLSPCTFERFSSFLEFCVKERLDICSKLIHYLDDFFSGSKTTLQCQKALDTFRETMSELGVPISDDKTEGPTEILTFLGLELNSINMTIKIPITKLIEIIDKINHMISKQKATVKEIQSLHGSLQFAARVIPMGRPFCRRLINTICGLQKKHFRVRIKRTIRLDLKVWKIFLTDFNGISMIHDYNWLSNHDVQLFTDSSGSIGWGIYFNGKYCQGRWTDYFYKNGLNKDITLLELFPIVMAVFVFGEYLANKRIRFLCDNEACVEILNKLSSKSENIMALVRLLTLRCIMLNMHVVGKWVPNFNNEIADSLSRFQNTRFRALAPEADMEPTQYPQFLLKFLELDLDNCYIQQFLKTHH